MEFALGLSAESLGKPELVYMDTPGTYSMFPKSSDEEVTLRALYENKIAGVILVLDGTQLERHLLFAQQVLAAGFSCLWVVTMSDLLQKEGIQLKADILSSEFRVPVILFDGQSGTGLQEIHNKASQMKLRAPKKLEAWTDRELDQAMDLARKVSRRSYGTGRAIEKIYERTAQIDQWLLGPVSGILIFTLAMTLLFSSIFWVAKPFMDGTGWCFDKLVDLTLGLEPLVQPAPATENIKAFVHLGLDFLAHGIFASLGSVAVFIPQIFILFIVIGFLESSGYLARAASLIDRPFSKLGLSGRSFVPVLSGFACAVPAIMATRNISSKRDRWITTFIIPLMTCSARLPVYALLLSFLLHDQSPLLQGFCLALLYFASLVLGAIAAGILNRFIKNLKTGFFLMELPLYRLPKASVLLNQALSRTRAYAIKAGPVILLFAIFIWAGTTFPNYNAESPQIKMQTSYLAEAGKKIEPALRPLGIDWRVGVGLMAAFAAREVFVSALSLVMNVGESEGSSEGLLKAMSAAKNAQGAPLFTTASVLGIILFFMIALQCMSTFSTVWRETNSLKFALGQLVLFNVLAYVASAGLVALLSY